MQKRSKINPWIKRTKKYLKKTRKHSIYLYSIQLFSVGVMNCGEENDGRLGGGEREAG
jgi:hypothetical protein